MTKEYIISLNEGVDYGQFWTEMETATVGSACVPDRPVDIVDERPGSQRCCHYALTDAEAVLLQNDSRVRGVELSPTLRTDIEIGRWAQQNSNFTKTTSDSGTYVNWGLLRSAYSSNVYGTSTTVSEKYPYHLDGSGVDVVISDSGIQVDHPEFQDANGVSRVQQIDWAAESGLGFGMSIFHYRDLDGHGTHVAGIAAGKTYGWAKNARIYSIKVNGLEGVGDLGGISIFQTQDAIKLWHLNKPIDPVTGKRRPTVVNMSWGYSTSYIAISNGSYRGTTWWAGDSNADTGQKRLDNFGILSTGDRIPVRQSWLDTDIDEMIAAGIIVCIAAGNTPYKADVASGVEYNNYFVGSYGTYYYHRGSSPASEQRGCFMVGCIDSVPEDASHDRAAWFSTAGPLVNIWAPGVDIMSATSTQNSWGSGSQPYYLNATFRQTNISGTSMASPQICGMVALYLQVNPGATLTEVHDFVIKSSQETLYSTGSDTDYAANYTLLGSPNRMAYMPFAADVGFTIEANLSQ